MPRKRKRRTIETDIFGLPVDGLERINVKVKGNTNEYEAANWTYRWTGEPFTRVPSSGGLRWKKASNVCGDIVCTNEDFNFPFSIETKHLQKVTITKVLRANSRIYSIWDQATTDALRANKEPMLLLRSNGMPKGTFHVFFRFRVPELEEIAEGGGIYGYKSEEVIKLKFSDVAELL